MKTATQSVIVPQCMLRQQSRQSREKRRKPVPPSSIPPLPICPSASPHPSLEVSACPPILLASWGRLDQWGGDLVRQWRQRTGRGLVGGGGYVTHSPRQMMPGPGWTKRCLLALVFWLNSETLDTAVNCIVCFVRITTSRHTRAQRTDASCWPEDTNGASWPERWLTDVLTLGVYQRTYANWPALPLMTRWPS